MEAIKKKGFDMIRNSSTENIYGNDYIEKDFSKIKIGLKTAEDAIFTLGDYRKVDPRLGDKQEILRAIRNGDLNTLRDVSNFFYRTSGIYNRLCRYMAYMYRYDWLVTPYVNSESVKAEKILEGFNKTLNFLDNFGVKRFFGEVALKVIRSGCYYGYIIHKGDRVLIQELPAKYCRTRFTGPNGMPLVEFNLKFFDDSFKDTNQKMRMLGLFPPEFKKAYILYKSGKLVAEYPGDTAGWYLLEGNVIKFNINGEDFPAFISVVPAIIDLDAAQDLDRRKMQQQLLKIIIQRMSIDKNGDLVFDIDEAQQLHNNAVAMLGKAIGIDVLTTFAEVDVADMADKNTSTTTDELEKVERTVYNEAGVSQMQFNTDGNIALEKSILNDEAALYNLIQQFEDFLNLLLEPFNKSPKKIFYRAEILPTTIYNYKEMAKLYKEQTQLGYSKMLPQIALGQSQSSILANAYFENDILDLVNVFIPPLMSSTMNAEVLTGRGKDATGSKESGRPEKGDDEKSTKTLQNKESMN